ncbi:MAG: chemotaxis protein CheA [Chloroflexi bacterium]|nr:chemotaxis protein CheA [Chloroflexota bacterium]
MTKEKSQTLQFELDDDDLKLFCEETDEQLELLDATLVQLEGEPDLDLVQQIFRAAHTLKGSSATIGHRKMASLTHAMESVLDLVRQQRLAPAAHVVDALLAALDALRVLANEVKTRIDSGLDIRRLEADLQALLVQETLTTPAEDDGQPAYLVRLTDSAVAATLEQMQHGKNACLVEVRFAPDSQLPGIRCYQALQELDSLGTLTWTSPERAILESGAGELLFAGLLTSPASEEQLRTAIAVVSDVASVAVRTLSSDDLARPLALDARQTVAEADAASRPQLTIVEADHGPADARGPMKKTAQSVRIDVERLDGLMNLVGELVIDRTRLQQIREALSAVLKDANLSELTENFEETTSHLARITDELQDEIMRSRMLPVRSVLTRLPRLVRDVATKCGKKVELITAGEETELDRSVIEEISDPLVHILRNAVDHGIETPEQRREAGKPETGLVTVTAWNQETYIYLSVKDDGKGIDCQTLRRKAVERGIVSREVADAASDEAVLQYVFYPGLSTARVLSDVSGRGVGMDIVRTNIERLNGQVTIHSTPGKGSEIIIQLPLTLATTKALMVVANNTVYAMPLVSVTEALADTTPMSTRSTGTGRSGCAASCSRSWTSPKPSAMLGRPRRRSRAVSWRHGTASGKLRFMSTAWSASRTWW